jgi:hypothetical protein
MHFLRGNTTEWRTVEKDICFLHLDELAVKSQVIMEQYLEIVANNICVCNKHAQKIGVFFRHAGLLWKSCNFHELMEMRSKCLAKETCYFFLSSM